MIKVYFPSGTWILCNNCGEPLLETTRVMKKGDIVRAKDVKTLNTPSNAEPGKKVECGSCGQPLVWFNRTVVPAKREELKKDG